MRFFQFIAAFVAVVATTSNAFKLSSQKKYQTKLYSGIFEKQPRSNKQISMNTEQISVMVNGMPGPMAVAVAEVCLDRGYNLIPIGFTGNGSPTCITVNSEKNGYVDVELMTGPGLNGGAGKMLESLKARHPNLIIVDYTHPSAILDNLKCYVDNDCDFVMGTTGGDTTKMMEIMDKGTNTAIIAPNMAKQIVALQASLQAMATRFPKSFADYKLTVTESHQSTKADTSGTAKAIVSHLLTLSPSEFKESDIVKLRDANNQVYIHIYVYLYVCM
jgi:4-hydroxy-tetrahydrodipicolinate reductase